MTLEVDWGSANHYGPYDFAMADSAVCLFGLCVDWKKAFSGRSSAAGNVFGHGGHASFVYERGTYCRSDISKHHSLGRKRRSGNGSYPFFVLLDFENC